MSAAVIGILMFVIMTVMILVGIPLAISMLGCAAVGLLLIGGPQVLFTQLTSGIMSISASYNFAVIPLFMVMGTLCAKTGIAEGAFNAARKWLGGKKGGLLDTVVVANMIFGACSGSSSAGNVVFSRIAYPELKRQGYDRGLSLSTIAGTGTLSVLIPPSMPIITFCLITNVSVGAALMTGLATGIFFAIIVIIMLHIYLRIFPNKVPPRDETKVPVKEKIASLKLLVPILLLFALIVGGSFLGWFPATTGGAIAFVVVFIYAVCKRMPFKEIMSGIWDGLQSFGNIYLIIIAGQMFGRLVTMSGLADTMASAIAQSNFPPFAVFTLVVVFYLFCGMFMDCLSIIIITVPIVFPALVALGYEPLILVMLLVFAMEVAGLTPPVGISVFHVANCTQESPAFIFKNIVKFFVLDIAIVLLLALIPDIILWLPRLLGYTV